MAGTNKTSGSFTIQDEDTGEKAKVEPKSSGENSVHVIAETNSPSGSTYPIIPADRVLWIDRRFSDGSTENMDLDGSSTPVDFVFEPPAGQVWYVDTLQIVILDAGTADIDDFGSISGGLTNGVQLVQKINGVEYELGNFKDNGALSLCFSQHAIFGVAGEDGVGWLDEDDVFMGVKEFNNTPVELRGDDGDQIIFRIRDNLNAIQRFQAVGRAWRLLP